jgi:hypothetical protein
MYFEKYSNTVYYMRKCLGKIGFRTERKSFLSMSKWFTKHTFFYKRRFRLSSQKKEQKIFPGKV